MSAATANVRTDMGTNSGSGTAEGLRRIRPVAAHKSRNRGIGRFFAVSLVFLVYLGMCLAFLAVPNKPETVLALAVGFTVCLCIVRWPIVGTFTCMIMAILFDSLPSPYVSTVISELGVFRNLSYKGLPQAVWLSLFEVLVVLTLASVLVRRWHAHEKMVRGALFLPMVAYGATVAFGEINGLLSGGDFKISLWELRPLGYIVVLYLLAVNTVSKPWHVRALIWVTVLTIGLRCLEGISRYYSISANLRGDIPSILEHDDSMLLAAVVALVIPVIVWRKYLPRRLIWTVVGLAPIAIYVMEINHRRAVYFCLILSIVTMLPLLWTSLPTKQARLRMAQIVAAVAVVGGLYVAAFWNSSNSIAKPAEAVRSIFAPDERDYLSNLYRDQENTNLHATIAHSPIIGVGFGKPMDVVVQMVNLTDIWALQLYMPHNNILWLWMRMGLFGFAVYWMMIGATLILIAASVRVGVKKFAYLISLEEKPELTEGNKARGMSSEVPGLRVVHITPKEEQSMIGHLRDQAAAKARREEIRECAEFILLAFLALGSLVSMMTLAQVDQGLMSPRLSSYWGLLLGTLTVAWETYRVRHKVPVVESEGKVRKGSLGTASTRRYKEIQGANRQRVRVITGPSRAA